MTVATRNLGGDGAIQLVLPAGRVDARLAPVLEDTLQRLIAGGSIYLLVDFEQVSFVASSGLKALIAARRKSHEAGGEVALANLSPQVQEVLEMTGVDRLFRIYPSRQAALAGLRQSPAASRQ